MQEEEETRQVVAVGCLMLCSTLPEAELRNFETDIFTDQRLRCSQSSSHVGKYLVELTDIQESLLPSAQVASLPRLCSVLVASSCTAAPVSTAVVFTLLARLFAFLVRSHSTGVPASKHFLQIAKSFRGRGYGLAPVTSSLLLMQSSALEMGHISAASGAEGFLLAAELGVS